MTDRIEKFEDIIAWQKARGLTARIYQLTGEGKFARDYGLKDQIQRASVSIMSNIAEGFERGRPTEFHATTRSCLDSGFPFQFLSVAKGSCAELRSQLYIAFDAGYIGQEVFDELMAKAIEVGRIVGGLRAAIERKRDLP